MEQNKKLTKEEFFDQISQLANFCDVELVRNVYYGMIKVLSRQLRAGYNVKMPDWGEYYLHNTVARQIRDVNTGMVTSIGMRKSLKFDPDYKVRAYFKGLGLNS